MNLSLLNEVVRSDYLLLMDDYTTWAVWKADGNDMPKPKNNENSCCLIQSGTIFVKTGDFRPLTRKSNRESGNGIKEWAGRIIGSYLHTAGLFTHGSQMGWFYSSLLWNNLVGGLVPL